MKFCRILNKLISLWTYIIVSVSTFFYFFQLLRKYGCGLLASSSMAMTSLTAAVTPFHISSNAGCISSTPTTKPSPEKHRVTLFKTIHEHSLQKDIMQDNSWTMYAEGHYYSWQFMNRVYNYTEGQLNDNLCIKFAEGHYAWQFINIVYMRNLCMTIHEQSMHEDIMHDNS